MPDLRAAPIRRVVAAGIGLILAAAAAACGTARPGESVAPTVTPSSSPSAAASGVQERGPAAYVSKKPLAASGGSKSKSPGFVENFDGPLSDEWGKYDTPDGTPPRSGDQVSVSGGMLHLRGGVNGRVGKDVGGGVMLLRDQKYGRWEVRFRVQAGAGYAGVVLLWPKENADWPAAGEIDLAEITNPARASFGSFLHHGKDNHKVGTDTKADFTKFHTVAVDWRPDRVTYYLDGKKYFSVTPGQIETGLPTESVMHLALQLDQGCDDFIPCRTASTPATVTMDVDWVKVYPVP
ncbi:glycoside hydrolase family 16 protein [Actinoplanes sp. CA-142083]|uniref:glycoside hydrolase family 16 protein n=1 Tax=Actinoplanes sp. CA-142083 TaxID=3239903 RepID=UPI003D90EC76